MVLRSRKFQLLLALPVVAVLALPGEAKPVLSGAAPAQSEFGLFLDPHLPPVLSIVLPKAYAAD